MYFINFLFFAEMPKILGIEFAPLHIPMERRLQTLAVQQWTFSFLFLGFGCLFIMAYLLFTSLYWIPLLYFAYFVYDRKKAARGGRRWQWVREWTLWKYFQQYFPINLIKTVDLDPNKNYIMGFHPHGVLSVSAFCHFATEGSRWSKIFPGITPYLLVLPGHFLFPVYRDYFMSGGKCMCITKTVIVDEARKTFEYDCNIWNDERLIFQALLSVVQRA
jgi:hypothetical protein